MSMLPYPFTARKWLARHDFCVETVMRRTCCLLHTLRKRDMGDCSFGFDCRHAINKFCRVKEVIKQAAT